MASIWETLEISSTTDRTEIRRAYARRLRVTHPEDDEAGFKALRAAYDTALLLAGAHSEVGEAPASGEVECIETESVASPRPPGVSDSPSWDHRAALSAARDQLEALVSVGSVVDPHTLSTALAAVLSSPALESVAEHFATERWLADLIIRNCPRADPLLAPAIARFRWEERPGPTVHGGATERVIARHEALRFLNSIRRNTPNGRALDALRTNSRGTSSLANLFSPGLPDEVRGLLRTIRTHGAVLMGDLSPIAVARWENYLSGPTLSPWTLWALITVPPFLTIASCAPLNPDLQEWAFMLMALYIGVGLVTLGLFFGVSWPRHFWRERWAAVAPPWARFGWAPCAALLLLASPLVPSGGPITWSFLLICVAMAGWAMVVGEPDTRPGKYDWRIRALMTSAYVVLWWVALAITLPEVAHWPMTAAVAVGVVATTSGAMSGIRLWRSAFSRGSRRLIIMALAAFAAVSALLLVNALGQAFLRPFAAMAIAFTVLAHRVPTATLIVFLRLRHFVMWFPFIVGVYALPFVAPSNLLIVGGAWLLTGVTIGLLGVWRETARE